MKKRNYSSIEKQDSCSSSSWSILYQEVESWSFALDTGKKYY